MGPESEHSPSDPTHAHQPTITESVTIHPELHLTENPEQNLVNRLENIFYRIGAVTRESTFNGVQRPLSHRRERARALKEIKKGHPDPQSIFDRERARDRILVDYLHQGAVEVEIPGMGIQRAAYTTLDLNEESSKSEQDSNRPVVIIGGISNALQAMQPLTEAVALEGRKVVTFGYPEDPMGSVTDEFADHVVNGEPFDAHAQFYTHTITVMQQTGMIPQTFDLWGYSTGAAIAAHMLNNPEFSDLVENAAFVCPAGTRDQSFASTAAGVLHDYTKILASRSDLAKYSYVTPRKEENSPTKTKVFKGLVEHVGKRHDASFTNARVRDGGFIVVLTEDDDQVTKSAHEHALFQKNPQVQILDDKGFHFTPLLEASRVASAILGYTETAPNDSLPAPELHS